MTLRTITFDDEQWQVVPKQLTPEMLGAALWPACLSTDYALALAAAPEPPAQQPPADCQSAFEAWFGFSVGPDMDLQTYVAWQHWQVAWNAAQPPAPQPITDDADPDAIVAPLPVPEVGEERQAMIDQLRDQAIELDMLREALGVPYEPHQSLLERMLEAARGRAGSGAAPEPPAQQPMSDEQIVNACYTYRHDFGLLPKLERHLLMAEARRWADAFGIGKGESNA